MSFEGPAIFGAGTFLPQLTVSTEFRRGLVFIVVTPFVIMSLFQGVPGWAAKGVSVTAIGKGLLREDALLPS